MLNIAFIGLGNMGGPMAQNLVAAGHSVTVFDLVPAAVAALVEAGAASADSALAASNNADCIISMLPAGKHVAGVYLGDDGLLNTLAPGTVVIDSSTIDAETAREVGAAAVEKGVHMIDAPVSGGVAAAQAGTLSFMCGGSSAAFEKALPVLQGMGKNIFHAGDAGAGQVAKMCNNMLLSVIMIGTSEALQLGLKGGLDPSTLSDIMQASTGRNWTLELYNPCPDVMDTAPSSNDYKPGFMVDLMCKDLNLAIGNAEQVGASTPLGSIAKQLFDAHAAEGNGQKDFSSIFTTLE
ncbi:MAG: 3-hydroxyisobutyrate dehydrogenase [Pseudomonadales bacterium]